MCRNLNILIARPSPPHQSYSARCSPNICQFVRCEPENRGLSRQPGRRVTPPPTGLAVHHKCDEQIHFGRVGESLKDAQNIKAESSCNVAAADHLWRAHHCVSALREMVHCPLPICAPYSVESAQQTRFGGKMPAIRGPHDRPADMARQDESTYLRAHD